MKAAANYFVRHWRGDLSLPVAYWINGSLLGVGVALGLQAAVTGMAQGGYSLRSISFVAIGSFLLMISVWIWSVVGIWRSADSHVAKGGSSGWATTAKAMVVLGAVAVSRSIVENAIPQIREFMQIAIGHDPLGELDLKLSSDGSSLIVSGPLREGSAAEMERLLAATPSITSIALDSNGGRLLEAQRIADVIKRKQLDTYVERQCDSACTFVFLAGIDRAATPNARIGFHQPSFDGLPAEQQAALTQDMLEVYRAAQMPESFLAKIARTPPNKMWYPTREELIYANVITRVTLGGETTVFGTTFQSEAELLLALRDIPQMRSVEQRFPGTLMTAAKKGWEVRQKGGNDAEIMTATRSVFADASVKLLREADDATRLAHLEIMIAQMTAAYELSADACTQLSAGTLDILNALPPEHAARELEWLEKASRSAPRLDQQPPDSVEMDKVMEVAVTNMPSDSIAVLASPEEYADQPGRVCESSIALLESMRDLPPEQRSVALWAMSEGGE